MSKTDNKTQPSAKKTELIRSIKFTLFSISAGAIQTGTFTLLTLITPMPYWPCYLISLVLSVVYNFTINRRFTFRSDANVPIAMLKVFGYYCVFTPLTTIGGDFLADRLGWNEFLVFAISITLNFITEFLFTRFIVYGKNVDSNKAYREKHKDEQPKDYNGPTVSRKALVVCAVCVVIAIAIMVVILVYGRSAVPEKAADAPTHAHTEEVATAAYPDSDPLVGKWISYSGGQKMIFDFTEDGKASFAYENGSKIDYDFSAQGDTITLSNKDKTQVYLWSPAAATFLCDRKYGEWQQQIVEKAEDTRNFCGYAYVEGDFLYIGEYTLCNELSMGYDDLMLGGSWIGAGGDRLSFDRDGGYYYKEYGEEYFGKFELNEQTGTLKLILGDTGTELTSEQWGIDGRVLHLNEQYYFYDPETAE